MASRRIRSIWLVILAALVIAAPRAYSQGTPPEFAARVADDVQETYVLQAGDVVEIRFFYSPEMNVTVPIRPDGKISLQLVDDIKAAGMTPSELHKALTEKFSALFIDPEIAVIVKEFSGRTVYVGGEVANPNTLPLKANMTVLQAVLNAGGFRDAAQTSNVIVISRGKDGTPVSHKFDLKKVLSGRALENDVRLKPYDIVFVPRSTIGKVNRFVDQYINKIIPNSLMFGGFSYVRYKGEQSIPTPAH